MRPVTLLLTGVPQFVTLVDLSYNLDRIFDTNEIGTFELRSITNYHGKRQIALDFSSGYDAIAAQERLDGYRYELPNGYEYTLCAKITRRKELMRRESWETWERSASPAAEQGSKAVALVPAMGDGDIARASAKLDAQLELLKKQKLVLQAEREILRERKKLKREYSSKTNIDSDDEPTSTRRRLRSPTRDTYTSRSPDSKCRESFHRTPSGSPPRAKLKELRSRSKEPETNCKKTKKRSPISSKKVKSCKKERSRSRDRRRSRRSSSRSRSRSLSRSRTARKRRRSRSRHRSRSRLGPRSRRSPPWVRRSPPWARRSPPWARRSRSRPGRGRRRTESRSPSCEYYSRQLAIMPDTSIGNLEAETVIVKRNIAVAPVVDYFYDNYTNTEQHLSPKRVDNRLDADYCKSTGKVTNTSKNTHADTTIMYIDVIPKKQTDGDKNNKQDLGNDINRNSYTNDSSHQGKETPDDTQAVEEDKHENDEVFEQETSKATKIATIERFGQLKSEQQQWLDKEMLEDLETNKDTHTNTEKDPPTELVSYPINTISTEVDEQKCGSTAAEVIEILDDPRPPPARPKFVVIIKKLLKQMKNSIRKANLLNISFQCKLKYVLKVLLREIVTGKDRMDKSEILASFREKYPKAEDDAFVRQVVEDINAGKYGDLGRVEGEEPPEFLAGNDLVLIEKEYDTITVIDSDEQPEVPQKSKVEEEPIKTETEATKQRRDGLDLKRQWRREAWAAWAAARGLAAAPRAAVPRVPVPRVLEPRALEPQATNTTNILKSETELHFGANLEEPNEYADYINDTEQFTTDTYMFDLQTVHNLGANCEQFNDLVNKNNDNSKHKTTTAKSVTELNSGAASTKLLNDFMYVKNDNEEVIKEEINIKVENNDIVPEFTDVEVENLLSSIQNTDCGYPNPTEETETPQVTAITIMTSYSELHSLKYGSNESAHKEVDIKNECDALTEEYIRDDAQYYNPYNKDNNGKSNNHNNETDNDNSCSKMNSSSVENSMRSEKTLEKNAPDIVDDKESTIQSATNIPPDTSSKDEESIESIVQYIMCLCNQSS